MMRTLLIGATLLAGCGSVKDKVVADAAPSDGAAVDGAADAPADAGTQAFEVVYGEDWRIAVDATNSGWFLLVANGDSDPDLATIQVVSVSDTHPIAIVRIVANPVVGLMTHGKAAGAIFVDNQAAYQAAITEPREHINDGLLSLNLLDAPSGDYIFNAHVELKVNNIPFALDFKLHHIDSPITYFAPDLAKRLVVRH